MLLPRICRAGLGLPALSPRLSVPLPLVSAPGHRWMSDISDKTTKDKRNLTMIVHYIIGKIRF